MRIALLVALFLLLAGCIEPTGDVVQPLVDDFPVQDPELMDANFELENGTPVDGRVVAIDLRGEHELGSTSGSTITINRTEYCENGWFELHFYPMDAPFDNYIGYEINDECDERWNAYDFWIGQDHWADATNPTTRLTFYDNDTSTPLTGYVFVNNINLGELEAGNHTVSKEALYNMVHNGSTLSVRGEHDGIDYEVCGWSIEPEEVLNYTSFSYYTQMEENIDDGSCRTAMSFVTPNDAVVMDALGNYSISSALPDQERAFSIYGNLRRDYRYATDEELTGKGNKMLMPSQTLASGKGDCEDWAVAFLSLMAASGIDGCAAVRADHVHCSTGEEGAHVLVTCKIGNDYHIFDQFVKYKGSDAEKLWGKSWRESFRDFCNVTATRAWTDTYYEEFSSNDELFDAWEDGFE